MHIEPRTRSALSFASTGLILVVVIQLANAVSLSTSSPMALLYGLAVPIVPFLALSIAVQTRRRDGRWRYREKDLCGLAVAMGLVIVLPYIWWWVEYGGDDYNGGGVNFALGCALVASPILLLFMLIFGLGLAAESTATNSAENPASD